LVDPVEGIELIPINTVSEISEILFS
jgi:hypothetical protein